MSTIPSFGEEVKRCSRCKKVKPLSEFSPRSDRPDRRCHCKACCAAQARVWQRNHEEQHKATQKHYGQQRNHRAVHLKQLYGLTIERFESMLVAQEGVCASCFGPPTGKNQQWHVDHDHKTGEIRGLLCNNCNLMIGLAHDNPEILRKAAEYLERAREVSQRA